VTYKGDKSPAGFTFSKATFKINDSTPDVYDRDFWAKVIGRRSVAEMLGNTLAIQFYIE
jgi:hypothetical protein